jgi:hypothetical protein
MAFRCGLEVGDKAAARFDRDDLAVVLPACSKRLSSRRRRSAGIVSTPQNSANVRLAEALSITLEDLLAGVIWTPGEIESEVDA